MTAPRWVTVVAAVFGITLAGASLAWACTAQPRVFSVMPESGPTGTALTVAGQAVQPNAPIEVRWNQLDGQRVGAAVSDGDGRFAVAMEVPDVAPGIYSLVFADASAGVGRMVFEVTPSEASVATSTRTPTEGLWANATARPDVPALGADRLALIAGAALVGIGSVALFAGFSAVALRRRRVLVRGTTHES